MRARARARGWLRTARRSQLHRARSRRPKVRRGWFTTMQQHRGLRNLLSQISGGVGGSGGSGDGVHRVLGPNGWERVDDSDAAADSSAAPFFEQQDVFISGHDDVNIYRIPALLVTSRGTLLAFGVHDTPFY
jgi:hypothetical protein